jgi:hypothetical protein
MGFSFQKDRGKRGSVKVRDYPPQKKERAFSRVIVTSTWENNCRIFLDFPDPIWYVFIYYDLILGY